MSDHSSNPSSADLEQRFFQGAKETQIQITLLQETYEEILAVIERSEWSQDKGLAILLAQGLGYAKGCLFLEADGEERLRTAERLARLESMYAVMKFETFRLMRDNQVLEMREAALRTSNVGLDAVVWRLHAENDELREELDSLRQQLADLQESAVPVQDLTEQHPSRLAVLLSWLKGKNHRSN